MGKKEKRKEKNKNAIFKKKKRPAKKKGVSDKLETKKKDVKKRKELQKEHKSLALKQRKIKAQAASLLQDVSRLQLESEEIKARLAAETENTSNIRDRIDNLETRDEAGQQAVRALSQQLGRQDRLVYEARSRLETTEQLASQVEHLREQIESLQAGKVEMEAPIVEPVMEGNELKSDNRDFEARIEHLSSGFDGAVQRLQESAGRGQVIETWMENLNRADSDLSQQMGQQQERIQGLADRAERLDQTALETTDSYRQLQAQVRELSGSLIAAEERLLGNNVELEKKSQHLESELRRLAARQGRLSASVLVAGILLLVLGGIGYWVKFNHLEDRTAVSFQQIEQISQRLEQQEGRRADQELHFSASKEQDPQAQVGRDWGVSLERIDQRHDAMDTSLKGFAQDQNEIRTEFKQFTEQQDEAGRQLAQVVVAQDELQAKARQQEEKLRSLEGHFQRVQAQVKAESAPTAVAQLKDTAWLQGLNPKHYTIQLVAAYDRAAVSRVAERNDLRESMVIHKGELRQRDWYVLLYGDFSSVREAKSTIQRLPEDIRANGPWVRNLSGIQKSLAE